MTEELINLLEPVVVGLLTGIVTGVIVTKYYRKKDEAIEKSKYINSLTKYIRKLRNEMFFRVEIYQTNTLKTSINL